MANANARADLTLSENAGDLAEARRAELIESLQRMNRYAGEARSDATRAAYASDLEDFRHWCGRYGREWLPATTETVGLYIGARAPKLKLSTLERRLAAISTLHKDEGYESPASVTEPPLRRAWLGLLKEKGRRQDKAKALTPEDLRHMAASLPRYDEPFGRGDFYAGRGDLTLTALRDRAVVLVGWAGAFRRSELVGLTAADVEWVDGKGMALTLTRSKSDQEGRGHTKYIPYGEREATCPVLALRAWAQAAAEALEVPRLEGELFRRFHRYEAVGASAMAGKYVTRVVRECLRRAGRAEETIQKYSSHSLRRGFITASIEAGHREGRVMAHSGHSSRQAFAGYVEEGRGFVDNPAEGTGI